VNEGASRAQFSLANPSAKNLDDQRDIAAPRAAYECPLYVERSLTASR
jgi:hypothetical protein